MYQPRGSNQAPSPSRAASIATSTKPTSAAAARAASPALSAASWLFRVPGCPAPWWPSGSPPGAAKPSWTSVGAALRRSASQTPVQRSSSAATSSAGVSLHGRSPSARWSGASTSTSGAAARSSDPGSSVALKYWPNGGWSMSSAIPCRAAARRRSGAKVLVVQVPTRPARSRWRSPARSPPGSGR